MGRILAIDDEPSIRMVLELALSSAGHEVVLAGDGLEGLEKLNEDFKPDLILVDLNMPRLSGKDFIQEMKKNPNYNNVCVAILSGSMLGVDDFPPENTYQRIFTKPFDLDELVDYIESLGEQNTPCNAN
ncbi:MAG: response regulator [Bacillota bacterium]